MQWLFDKLDLVAAWLLKDRGLTYTQYFILRELLHFSGGFLIALLPVLLHSIIAVGIIGVILAAIIIYKEVKEDMVSQPRYKTIVDCLAWIIGFLSAYLLLY